MDRPETMATWQHRTVKSSSLAKQNQTSHRKTMSTAKKVFGYLFFDIYVSDSKKRLNFDEYFVEKKKLAIGNMKDVERKKKQKGEVRIKEYEVKQGFCLAFYFVK
jgi:hypothetical protein